MKTILNNATLIDCVQPTPAANTTVVIDDGRISQILKGARPPSAGEATVLDLEIGRAHV